MAFKFYIDNQLTDQPDNDMELITTLRRDADFGGFLVTQDVTLSYTGNNSPASGTISGYTYLKSKFDSGTCNTVEIVIYDEVGPTETYRVYTGVIIVPAMEVLEHVVRITVKIDDNSFYTYVKNNQNIPFNLYAVKTKNSQVVAAPDIYQVDMFDSQTGTFLSTIGNLYRGYKVYDVLEFLLLAISDNKVGFQSDFLDTNAAKLFIFDGAALVNPNSSPNVTVTFGNLLRELIKLYNLSFYIDMVDPDNPVFRLEPQSWFYVGTNVFTFTEPKEIKSSVKASKLFGTIKVGSEYNPGGSAASIYTWIAGTSYFGWKEEVYTPFGQCNTDAELDLVNEFHISSNAINDQVNGAINSNLDDVFLVECENVDSGALTASAIGYTTYATPPKLYYNVGLNNVNKLTYHGGNWQQAITNTQSTGTNIFKASLGQDTTILDQTGGSGLQFPQIINPFPFADEFGGGNYDPGGNYDNVLFFYQAPLPGNYSFVATLELDFANFKECTAGASILYVPTGQTIFTQVNYGYHVTLSIISYSDSTLTTITNSSTVNLIDFQNTLVTPTSFPVTFTAPLAIGECVLVQVMIQAEAFAPFIFGMTPLTSDYAIQNCTYSPDDPRQKITALENSTFMCTGTPDGGLTLAPFDPQLYKSKLHEFEYPMTMADFRTILTTPLGAFNFIKDNSIRRGWIEEIEFNSWNGKARVKLISNDA